MILIHIGMSVLKRILRLVMKYGMQVTSEVQSLQNASRLLNHFVPFAATAMAATFD